MAFAEEPFPSELVYVSKRRTREIVEHYEAQHRMPVVKETRLDSPHLPLVPTVGVSLGRRESHKTVAEHAVKATRHEKHRTGTLWHPNRFDRMTLDFHRATLDVPFAWETPVQQPVATLFASEWVDGVGRVW